jgi:hypothetical protein
MRSDLFDKNISIQASPLFYMIYSTYWSNSGLLGIWTLSIVRYSKTHSISENGSVSFLKLVSETSCSLEYRTMCKVRKPSIYECYTPSSELYAIYSLCCLTRLPVALTTYTYSVEWWHDYWLMKWKAMVKFEALLRHLCWETEGHHVTSVRIAGL